MTNVKTINDIANNIARGHSPILGIGSKAAASLALEAGQFVNEVHQALKDRAAKYVADGVAEKSAKRKSTDAAIMMFTPAPAVATAPAQPEPAVEAPTEAQLKRLRKDDLVALAMQMLAAK